MIAAKNIAQSYNLADMQYVNSNGFFDLDNMIQTPDSLSISYSPTTRSFNDASPTIIDNFPLADLSAMMFPNPDPLAYPTQQTDNNNVNFEALFKDMAQDAGSMNTFAGTMSMQNNPSGFIPPSSYMYQSSDNQMSQEGEVPLLGPMPMYMMQGGSITHDQPTPSSGGTASPNQYTINNQPQNSYDTPQITQRNGVYQSNHPRNIQLDSLLGNEEWNGLPADRIAGAGSFVNPQLGRVDGSFTGKQEQAAPSPEQNGQIQFGELAPGTHGWGLEGF